MRTPAGREIPQLTGDVPLPEEDVRVDLDRNPLHLAKQAVASTQMNSTTKLSAVLAMPLAVSFLAGVCWCSETPHPLQHKSVPKDEGQTSRAFVSLPRSSLAPYGVPLAGS